MSGPITTGEFKEAADYRFGRALNYLRKHFPDAVILNPFSIPKGLSQESYMDISFALIRACTHIYMMKGWSTSKGCLAERAYASKLELPVISSSYKY
jgi:hypothetical protein